MQNPFKTYLIIALSLLTASVEVLGQSIVRMDQEEILFDEAARPSVTALIQPDSKEVKKAMDDYFKKEYDINFKGIGLFANKDVLYAEEIQFEPLSEMRSNLYARIVPDEEKTKINLFATLGYDVNISEKSHPESFQKLENMLYDFLAFYLPEYYSERVTAAQDQLEELMSEQKDYKNNIDENESEIIDLRKEIEELLQENEELLARVKKLDEKIEASQKKLNDQKYLERKTDLSLTELRKINP